MRAKVVILVLLAALLAFGSVAQEAAPLKIGLLTDLSGVLAIYGIELDNGLKLGLLYAAGIDPAEYDSLDAALADLTTPAGQSKSSSATTPAIRTPRASRRAS